MIAPEHAAALIAAGESQTVELKAESEYQTGLAETMVALANAAGGAESYIFVGVQSRPVVVRGVDDAATVVDRLFSAARQVSPPLHDLLRVAQLQLEDKIVVAALLPAHAPGVYGVGGRYLIRRGAQNLPLTPGELLRLLGERGIYSYEDQPVPGAALADIEMRRVRWYLERRAASRLSPLPFSDPEEVLEKLGLIAPGGGPTVAAILFFGRQPQRYFPHMLIRCARFAGEWTNRFIDQAEYGGTMTEMIDAAFAFVQRNTAHTARIVGVARVDEDSYPAVAVREAIANAVAHRDLTIINSTIRVFVFDNRIEIDSPGGLLPGLTVENMARLTRLRNKRLAELLFGVGYIERQGTGIRRMIGALREAGLPDPKIENFADSLLVTLEAIPAAAATAPHSPASHADDEDESEDDADLNLRQRRLLPLLRDRGAITRADYESYFHVGTRTAKRDLKGLLDRKLIELRGSSTASYYVLGKEG